LEMWRSGRRIHISSNCLTKYDNIKMDFRNMMWECGTD
jgi:hypothetical protein